MYDIRYICCILMILKKNNKTKKRKTGIRSYIKDELISQDQAIVKVNSLMHNVPKWSHTL